MNSSRRHTLLSWGLLIALLGVNVPPFVCMGLDPDPIQWDLFARNVVNGGVPYRDVCENNLPGMLWLHCGIRALFGWSSEALRIADLVVMSGAVALLVFWLPSLSRWQRALSAALLFAFYLSTSEWCHCQRDPWMLLPALFALTLRFAQTQRVEAQASSKSVLAFASLEGLLWGAAIWIKPYVIVPAVAVWLWSARLRSSPRATLIDLAGLLTGGIVAGAAGVFWLQSTGAWPHFAEILFDWNRDYLAVDVYDGVPRHYILIAFAYHNWPWWIAYLIALPYALVLLCRWQRFESGLKRSLLAVFFLAWFAQAVFMQHCYDYVHTPAFMIALVLIVDLGMSCRGFASTICFGLLAALGILAQGAVLQKRVPVAIQCIGEGLSPQMRDRLGLRVRQLSWVELDQVAEFIRTLALQDGELTCLDMPSAPLYLQLGIAPSTRYTLLHNSLFCFRSHREEIKAAVSKSRTQWLVCAVTALPNRQSEVESDAAWGPWKLHIMFRTDHFLVLQMNGEETRRWLTEVLGY